LRGGLSRVTRDAVSGSCRGGLVRWAAGSFDSNFLDPSCPTVAVRRACPNVPSVQAGCLLFLSRLPECYGGQGKKKSKA